MSLKSKCSVVLIIFFALSVKLQAQSIESLQQEIEKAQQEIARSKSLLNSNRSKQQDGVAQLRLLQSNIKNRKAIIRNLNKQEKILNSNIYSSNGSITKYKSQLDGLKSDYSKIILNGYKDFKQGNYLLFLFSSSDFQDMVLRSEYVQRSAVYAKAKSDSINNLTEKLKNKVVDLKKQTSELKSVIKSKNSEVLNLAQEESDNQVLLKKLKNEESSLNNKINESNRLVLQLEKQIQKIIEEEAAKHNKSVVTDDDREKVLQLSGTFEQNKGKLPRPTENGVITSYFGVQQHPTQKNVKVKNNGVNFALSSPSIYSVFEGEVVKVFFFQGLNKSIMIRHGKYITVYSNLSDVNVKVGDKVKTREKIGSVKIVGNDTVFHFELWCETTPMDPQVWLK